MSAEHARAFVDTNIIVYAYDASAGPKRERAAATIRDLWRSGTGCISVQVLQEFFVAVTRKAPRPVEPHMAANAVADLARWTTHSPDADDVLAAIELHARMRISFWDAMIVQSALSLDCEVLLSEDLNPGQRYDGVLVVDPFADRTAG